MVYGIIIAVLLFGTLIYFGVIKKKKNQVDIDYVEYDPVECGGDNECQLTKFEEELLFLINEHRLSINLNFVKPEKLARETMETHVDYMISVGHASHDNFPDRVHTLLVHQALTVGECVAYGYGTTKGTLNGYLNSVKGHKRIIEDPDFTHVGIRSKKDKTQRYYNGLLFWECDPEKIKNE